MRVRHRTTPKTGCHRGMQHLLRLNLMSWHRASCCVLMMMKKKRCVITVRLSWCISLFTAYTHIAWFRPSCRAGQYFNISVRLSVGLYYDALWWSAIVVHNCVVWSNVSKYITPILEIVYIYTQQYWKKILLQHSSSMSQKTLDTMFIIACYYYFQNLSTNVKILVFDKMCSCVAFSLLCGINKECSTKSSLRHVL